LQAQSVKRAQIPLLQKEEIQPMHPCPKCGNQVPDDQAFCRNCGAPQMPATAQPQSQSPDWELGATIVGKNFPVTPPPARPSTPPPAKPQTNVAPPSTPVTPSVTPAPVTPPNTSAPSTPKKSRKGLLIGAGVLIGGFIALIIILIIIFAVLASR
jgi:hypothetical protein